ncbi:pyridoxal phosphate-dependent aminotransferase [Oleiphilus messinensis]|nr:aminotransferase class I/II-fold pyridoxal phosphate-dependent enzyme [Oleiphilus messinensis]
MNNNSDRSSINLNVRGILPSATLRINELSNKLKSEGKEIFKLGLGQSPFPVPEVVVESLRQHAHEKDYLPVMGLMALRQSIAEYMSRVQHISRRAEDIIIGPGSKELLFIMQMAYYGDLLIPRPSWVSYAPQARLLGRSVYWLPTGPENNWQLTADELDLVCRDDPTRPRILILNYPSNPTGCTYTDDQLLELAYVARKYNIVLLSDEIYGETRYDGEHKSIARYYPEGTIISTGLSKWCGAGGWRLGAFIFPQELKPLQEAMAIIASETFTATSAPIQYAAIRAFQGGEEIDNYLATSRRVLAALGEFIYTKLSQMQVKLNRPEGGFYVFPDFDHYRQDLAKHNILTSASLCNRLLEDTGIAMLPASDFGFTPDTLISRIAFVDFDGQAAIQAADSIGNDTPLDESFIIENCPKIATALTKMEAWFKGL